MKKKRIKKLTEIISYLTNTKICIIGIPEGKERGKEVESIFIEIMAEN